MSCTHLYASVVFGVNLSTGCFGCNQCTVHIFCIGTQTSESWLFNNTCHIKLTFIWPDFYIRKWNGWWWSQATHCNSANTTHLLEVLKELKIVVCLSGWKAKTKLKINTNPKNNNTASLLADWLLPLSGGLKSEHEQDRPEPSALLPPDSFS